MMFCNYLGDGSSTSGSTVFNNSISNITTNGTTYGLYISTIASPNYPASVYTNTISGLTSNGGASSLYGSYVGSSGAGVNYFKNKIYDLTQNGTTGALYGLYATTSPTSNIYNNLIGSIATPSSTGDNRLHGV